MGLKLSNWSKKTPAFWKKIGDWAIYSQPVVIGVLTGSPFSADVRIWAVFTVSAIFTGLKVFTKFKAIEDEK